MKKNSGVKQQAHEETIQVNCPYCFSMFAYADDYGNAICSNCGAVFEITEEDFD